MREQLPEVMERRTTLQRNPSQRTKHQGARQKAKWFGNPGLGDRRHAWECVFTLPGKMSDILLQASVQVIDSIRCNADDAYQGEVTEKMVCAGIPEGGVDTCQVGPPRIMGSSRNRV